MAAAAIGIAFLLVGIDPLWALPIILCLGIAVLGAVEFLGPPTGSTLSRCDSF